MAPANTGAKKQKKKWYVKIDFRPGLDVCISAFFGRAHLTAPHEPKIKYLMRICLQVKGKG